jgi:hypothetical protein
MRRTLFSFVCIAFSAAVCVAQIDSRPSTLTIRSAADTGGGQSQRTITVVTVPADTEAAIEMLSGLHSRVSHVDDPIEARLTRPVYVDGQVALPFGTLIQGHIARVQSAGRMHHGAEMTLRFDEISLPDGQSAPISAIISSTKDSGLREVRVDEEGNLKGSRGFSLKHMVGGVAGVASFTTIRAAVAGAATIAYSLPASGAAFVGYELLAPRGNEVHVPPETQFRIRLNNPVTIQVHT